MIRTTHDLYDQATAYVNDIQEIMNDLQEIEEEVVDGAPCTENQRAHLKSCLNRLFEAVEVLESMDSE